VQEILITKSFCFGTCSTDQKSTNCVRDARDSENLLFFTASHSTENVYELLVRNWKLSTNNRYVI